MRNLTSTKVDLTTSFTKINAPDGELIIIDNVGANTAILKFNEGGGRFELPAGKKLQIDRGFFTDSVKAKSSTGTTTLTTLGSAYTLSHTKYAGEAGRFFIDDGSKIEDGLVYSEDRSAYLIMKNAACLDLNGLYYTQVASGLNWNPNQSNFRIIAEMINYGSDAQTLMQSRVGAGNDYVSIKIIQGTTNILVDQFEGGSQRLKYQFDNAFTSGEMLEIDVQWDYQASAGNRITLKTRDSLAKDFTEISGTMIDDTIPTAQTEPIYDGATIGAVYNNSDWMRGKLVMTSFGDTDSRTFHYQDQSGLITKSIDGSLTSTHSNILALGARSDLSYFHMEKFGANKVGDRFVARAVENGLGLDVDVEGNPMLVYSVPMTGFKLDAPSITILANHSTDILSDVDQLKTFADESTDVGWLRRVVLFTSNFAGTTEDLREIQNFTHAKYAISVTPFFYMLNGETYNEIHLRNTTNRDEEHCDRVEIAEINRNVGTIEEYSLDSSVNGTVLRTIQTVNKKGEVTESKVLSVKVNANPDSIKTVNIIITGHSFVFQNTIVSRIRTYVEDLLNTGGGGSVTLLGLNGTAPNENEGASGKTADWFINTAHVDNNVHISGTYDPTQYITDNHSAEWLTGDNVVNIVVIVLGANALFNNDNNYAAALEDADYLQDMINAWNNQANTDHVLVYLGNDYGAGESYRNINNVYNNILLDRIHGADLLNTMNLKDASASTIGDYQKEDNVHPSTIGYEDMAKRVQGIVANILDINTHSESQGIAASSYAGLLFSGWAAIHTFAGEKLEYWQIDVTEAEGDYDLVIRNDNNAGQEIFRKRIYGSYEGRLKIPTYDLQMQTGEMWFGIQTVDNTHRIRLKHGTVDTHSSENLRGAGAESWSGASGAIYMNGNFFTK